MEYWIWGHHIFRQTLIGDLFVLLMPSLLQARICVSGGSETLV
jgi:hypothetical protein